MHPKVEDWEQLRQRIGKIIQLYHSSKEYFEKGINVICVDEKTGMQALERINPDLDAKPGRTKSVEYEYIRHGTKCLIANFEAATGKCISPTILDTRTEEDFLKHIQQTVAVDREKQWIFIADQLNTHKSESLVKWVAQEIGFEGDLGKKRKEGILKDMESRKAFLENENHSIRFVFTPKHCSWLNWVEVWFSKLGKRMLNKGNFKSIDDLVDKVTRFIEYHNLLEAKPYLWKACPDKIVHKIKETIRVDT